MQAPTLRDVYEAKRTIAPYLPRTPLHYSAGLSEVLQAQVYLKHDEYLPLGAFKARGGINLLSHLTKEDIQFFQQKVDNSWEKWWLPGLIPFGMKEE